MTQGNYIISDPGKIFRLDNKLAFRLPSGTEGYELVDIDKDNISFDSTYVYIDNKFALRKEGDLPLKGRLINKVYSNDDELAILLNYQSSHTKENTDKLKCLQDWREWCGDLARIIQSKLS